MIHIISHHRLNSELELIGTGHSCPLLPFSFSYNHTTNVSSHLVASDCPQNSPIEGQWCSACFGNDNTEPAAPSRELAHKSINGSQLPIVPGVMSRTDRETVRPSTLRSRIILKIGRYIDKSWCEVQENGWFQFCQAQRLWNFGVVHMIQATHLATLQSTPCIILECRLKTKPLSATASRVQNPLSSIYLVGLLVGRGLMTEIHGLWDQQTCWKGLSCEKGLDQSIRLGGLFHSNDNDVHWILHTFAIFCTRSFQRISTNGSL